MSNWIKTNIGAIVDFYNGKAHEDCVDDNGDFFLVNSKFVSTSGNIYKKSSEQRFPLKRGDITMVMSDVPNGKALARCFIVRENNKYTLNQRICCFRPNDAIPEFLFHILDRNKFYLSFDSGVTQTNLRKEEVLECPILLPPLPEQRAIADTLQTWDTAIEKTEALIAAKEKQFDWLLHNLIIKNRGRGVSSEWHRTHLGNICSVRTGQSAPQDETLFSPKGIPFIRVSSLDYLLGKSNSKKIEYISEETGEKLNFQLFDEGTLVFAKSGMSALQSRIHKLSEPSFIVSHLCALTPKNSITGNYLEYYLKSYHPNQLIQGDGFPSIRTSEISSFPIWLPSLPEQKRIAETLNTARQEIDTLKTLADRYRAQKRGLMQKLLTGKWRVKVKYNQQNGGS